MRPFRFGLIWSGESSPVDVARRAELAGYSTLLFPDHTGMLAPIPAMAAAAAVTSGLRLGTQVVNVAFRKLGALAQELAAVDVISNGRLEIGLGAGYAEDEVRSLGLPFPTVKERVAEVERSLELLPRLFAGETVTDHELREYRLDPAAPQGSTVPLMVGGNGDRMLGVAAKAATIVQFTGFTAAPRRDFRHYGEEGLANRVAYVRDKAGSRFDSMELGVLVQRAGRVEDPAAVAAGYSFVRDNTLTVDEALTSPHFLFGEPEEIGARLVDLRKRYGVSYFAVFDGRSEGFDEVVASFASR